MSKKKKKKSYNFETSQDWHKFYENQHIKQYRKYGKAENLIKSLYHGKVYVEQDISKKSIPWNNKKKIYSNFYRDVMNNK